MRRARPDDAPALAAAQRDIVRVPGRLASAPDEIHESAIRKTIEDLAQHERGIFVVAEDDGVVVGHAFLEPIGLRALHHVVRVTLAVHEGHQGKGIGRALMNELLDWARSNPRIEKVELQVRSSNDAAIALYRSLGFVEEGRWTNRLKLAEGHYLDDVCMALAV